MLNNSGNNDDNEQLYASVPLVEGAAAGRTSRGPRGASGGVTRYVWLAVRALFVVVVFAAAVRTLRSPAASTNSAVSAPCSDHDHAAAMDAAAAAHAKDTCPPCPTAGAAAATTSGDATCPTCVCDACPACPAPAPAVAAPPAVVFEPMSTTLVCEQPTLDIAWITQYVQPSSDIKEKLEMKFLWPEGPENRVEMPRWFNSREKYVVSGLVHTLRHKDPLHDVFIDIGHHQGYLSTVAGHMGFKAIGFDMQRLCVRLGRCGHLINGYVRHEVHHAYVAPPGTTKSVLVSANTCQGGTQVPNSNDPSPEKVEVPPIDVSKLVLERMKADPKFGIAAVKIDTEGNEVTLLETLKPILQYVDTIIFEITPSSWPHFSVSVDDGIKRLGELLFRDTSHGGPWVATQVPDEPDSGPSSVWNICDPPLGRQPPWVIPDYAAFEAFVRALAPRNTFENLILKKKGASICS